MWKLLSGFLVAIFAMSCIACAQQSGPATMQQLAFMRGSWTCTVQNGASTGLVQRVTYSFSSDGLWMTELSHDAGSKNDWETQMWGYDAHAKKLVAYQFTPDGVYTKSVKGFVGKNFVATRNDDGATVSIVPLTSKRIDWVITSADHSTVVKEHCVRR